jgi:hypothetical protein
VRALGALGALMLLSPWYVAGSSHDTPLLPPPYAARTDIIGDTAEPALCRNYDREQAHTSTPAWSDLRSTRTGYPATISHSIRTQSFIEFSAWQKSSSTHVDSPPFERIPLPNHRRRESPPPPCPR